MHEGREIKHEVTHPPLLFDLLTLLSSIQGYSIKSNFYTKDTICESSIMLSKVEWLHSSHPSVYVYPAALSCKVCRRENIIQDVLYR